MIHDEIDLSALNGGSEAGRGRIRRYWGGNLKYYDLTQPVPAVECSDSAYKLSVPGASPPDDGE